MGCEGGVEEGWVCVELRSDIVEGVECFCYRRVKDVGQHAGLDEDGGACGNHGGGTIQAAI